MKLCDGERTLEFEIVDYQYPDCDSLEENSAFDTNWLEIDNHYYNSNIDEKYSEYCLLTNELSELCETLKNVIDGADNSYISNFLEPFLHICIVKFHNDVFFTLNFAYDVSHGWKERKITAVWTENEAKAALEDLREMEQKFPERQIGC